MTATTITRINIALPTSTTDDDVSAVDSKISAMYPDANVQVSASHPNGLNVSAFDGNIWMFADGVGNEADSISKQVESLLS